MPFSDKAAKAAYDRLRRQKLPAYERERSARRRKDPAYTADQLERKRAWRLANRERHLATQRAYEAKLLAETTHRRIAKNLRHRVRKAMLGETRGVSAVRLLGLSIPELRTYLAAKFPPGMTWENYGTWHIDHVRPLASFDLTDPEQAKSACHFSNLQPLWAGDNLSKGCRHPARRA